MDALVQSKLDEHVVKLFQSAYLDCKFSPNIDGATSPPFKMLIGVKQGDKLKRAGDNVSMDPLIQWLTSIGQGYSVGNSDIAAILYTDDLVLVSSFCEDMS